jgi:hypothetical protein
MRIFKTVLTALAVALLTGCSDKPEVAVQKAFARGFEQGYLSESDLKLVLSMLKSEGVDMSESELQEVCRLAKEIGDLKRKTRTSKEEEQLNSKLKRFRNLGRKMGSRKMGSE